MINSRVWKTRLSKYGITSTDRSVPSALFSKIGVPLSLLVMVVLAVQIAYGSIPISGGQISSSIAVPSCTIPFSVEETLLYPTAVGVSFTAIPEVGTSIYLEYGVIPGRFSKKTETKYVNANEPAKFEITGLSPGKKYYYRVRCTNENEIRHGARETHSFTTLRNEGDTFMFDYGTDSHFYAIWANDTFGNSDLVSTLIPSFENMKKDNADFQIIGGDFAMTSCGCKGGNLNGEIYPAGSVENTATALQRYKRTFAPDIYGLVSKDMPFVYDLGNHEGEAGFDSTEMSYSLEARKTIFPNMPKSYASNPEDSYYYFDSGDARFIFIDVMRYTTVTPESPDDWTLGPEQMQWFERVLRSNNKKWVFIVAEHLDGGEPAFSGDNDTWYGRGGLRATLDDLPTGIFKGEQAQIQSLEEKYLPAGGAIFHMSGHDHVAQGPTEKLSIDGSGTRTYMLKGGRMSAVGNEWADSAGFKKEMDWDLDGKADYLQSGIGTVKQGYYRITVNGKDSVTFDYVQSSKNAANNGIVSFTKTVYAENA